MKNTRKAYYDDHGLTFCMGDTVKAALEANLSVKEYEEKLIDLNPQIEIYFKIEPMGEGV